MDLPAVMRQDPPPGEYEPHQPVAPLSIFFLSANEDDDSKR
jgi:hypothetical protein